MARRRSRRRSYGGFAPYVPVAQRRKHAERFAREMERAGTPLAPVSSRKRDIAATFWGRSWCRNLESYGDYANRLPRGRTYVRNGSVIDLRIGRGRIDAYVAGSEIYEVEIHVEPLDEARWAALRAACSGSVASLVELLEGRLSEAVMERLTSRADGLFPSPKEIWIECSCPDGATVCKHVAASLYGVGVRFDDDPEVFFVLRGVDARDLLAAASSAGLAATAAAAADASEIADDDLASVFGIDLDDAPAPASSSSAAAATSDPANPASAASSAAAATSDDEPTLTAAELVAAGIPRSTITSWLRRGALAPSDTRGVYAMTDTTGETLERYFARRPND